MRIADYLTKEACFSNFPATSRDEVLRKMVKNLKSKIPDLDEDQVFEQLIEREEQASTAIGTGVAIPHTAIEGLEKPHLAAAMLQEGIDFKARDGQAVDLVVLILFPAGATGIQLKLLARLARLLSDPPFIKNLEASKDDEAFYEMILAEDQKHV